MNDYASFLLHSSQATEEYIFTVWFHGKRTIVTVNYQHNTKENKRGARQGGTTICLKRVNHSKL